MMNQQKIALGILITLLILVGSSLTAACTNASQETIASEEVILVIDPTAAPSVEPSPTIESSPTFEPTVQSLPTSENSDDGELASTGKELLDEQCTVCHGLSRVTNNSMTLEQWRQTVARMVDEGAILEPNEVEILSVYLAETYP